MIIENKKWLDDLYLWLHDSYRYKETFGEFCSLISDCKKCGISYDELYIALSHLEKIAEDILELSILTKNNICYKYRISEKAYHHFARNFFYGFSHDTDTMLFKDFLDREDCAEL